MNSNRAPIDPRELCSRKLWQLVNTPEGEDISEQELRDAIVELSRRRRHLLRLEQSGKLDELHSRF